MVLRTLFSSSCRRLWVALLLAIAMPVLHPMFWQTRDNLLNGRTLFMDTSNQQDVHIDHDAMINAQAATIQHLKRQLQIHVEFEDDPPEERTAHKNYKRVARRYLKKKMPNILQLSDKPAYKKNSIISAMLKASLYMRPGNTSHRLRPADRKRKKQVYMGAEFAEFLLPDVKARNANYSFYVYDSRDVTKSYCCYHSMPFVGHLPESEFEMENLKKAQVVVTYSLFFDEGFCSQSAPRYREGLLQIVESLPRVRLRVSVTVVIFHWDGVPTEFMQLLNAPHVVLVPVKANNFEVATARFWWHDPYILEKELGFVPDLITTADGDEILDSPMFDWWVRLALSYPHYLFLTLGMSVMGTNGIPRVFDGCQVALAPKRLLNSRKLNGWSAGGLGPCSRKFLVDHKPNYGVDEEALVICVSDLLERNGPEDIFVLSFQAHQAMIFFLQNTGGQENVADSTPSYEFWCPPTDRPRGVGERGDPLCPAWPTRSKKKIQV